MEPASTEPRIAEFIGKYSAEIAAAIVGSRKKLRALFPRGYELVFDNYNALVIGYSPSQKSPDAFLSIAAYPRWITLFFLHGATLDDPDNLLEGSGTQVRGIKLKAPSDLDDERVRKLIAQALSPVAGALSAAPPLTTVIKMVAAKQRPRRPAVQPKTDSPGPKRPKAK